MTKEGKKERQILDRSRTNGLKRRKNKIWPYIDGAF